MGFNKRLERILVLEADDSWPIQQIQGRYYRVDPKAKSPAQRMRTKEEVDSSEGVVIATIDQFGDNIHNNILKARRDFADNALSGKQFTHKGYPGQLFKVVNGNQIAELTSGRSMGTLTEMANNIQPGDVNFEQGSEQIYESAGVSEQALEYVAALLRHYNPDATDDQVNKFMEKARRGQPIYKDLNAEQLYQQYIERRPQNHQNRLGKAVNYVKAVLPKEIDFAIDMEKLDADKKLKSEPTLLKDVKRVFDYYKDGLLNGVAKHEVKLKDPNPPREAVPSRAVSRSDW